MNARLPVVQTTHRQDCSTCRTQPVCWDQRLNTPQIAANLLACRVYRHIDTDRSMRAFLDRVKFAVRKRAKNLPRHRYASQEALEREMMSILGEQLMQLIPGAKYHPLQVLLGERSSVVKAIQRDKTFLPRDKFTSLHDSDHKRDAFVVEPQPVEDDAWAEQHRVETATAVIEDGRTLNADEFLVLSFCMAAAKNCSRPVHGLHSWLAEHTPLRKAAVTTAYRQGTRKLVEAMNALPSYFAARGIRWRPREGGLRASDVIELLEARATHGTSQQDLAWGFGVSEAVVQAVIRRFSGRTPAEIRAVMGE